MVQLNGLPPGAVILEDEIGATLRDLFPDMAIDYTDEEEELTLNVSAIKSKVRFSKEPIDAAWEGIGKCKNAGYQNAW